jgi:hypothetical protein
MNLAKQGQKSGLQLSKEYLAMGLPIIPVPFGTKAPVLTGWTSIEINSENVGKYFSNAPSNIAIALGKKSTNYVDIDLDCEDAVHFSKDICADTGFIYGREYRPASHRIYQLADEQADSMQFQLPDGEMIVEIRGSNHLSILPGSKGINGDYYISEKNGKPSPISYKRLKRDAATIAICVLCTRFWPKKGGRNSAALALSGMMYKSGMTLEDAILIIKLVTDKVGDEEGESRVKTAIETYKKGEAGEKITGISMLLDFFSEEAVACLGKWLGTEENLFDPEFIEEFNNMYAVVRLGNKCKILTETKSEYNLQIECSFIDRPDFFAFNADKRVMVNGKEVELARLWFNHPMRRMYDKIVFQPGKQVPSGTYNMWTGFNVIPQVGSCELILFHILNVIADGDEIVNKWVLSWLAQCIQYPYDKQGTAIVLQGEQGTGKSILGDYMSRIFGKHYLSVAQPKHIQGAFNAHLQYCVLLCAEEAFWGGDKKVAGIFKDLITSKTMPIEKKGIDVTNGDNHIHAIITTNNDWAVPADFGERRFSVVHVSNAVKGNTEYFNALAAEMDGDGPASFLGYLLKYDFSKVDLRKPLKTKALAEQILLGANDKLGQFVFKCLYEGKIYPDNPTWPQRIPTEHFAELYQKWSKDHSMKGNSLATYFGRGIKRYIPGIDKKKLAWSDTDLYSGSPIMHTNSKQIMFYTLPPLSESRQQFEKVINNPCPWPEED